MENLSIIQKTYDFIVWFVPILNRLPRDQKFMLGNRIISGLYDLLEQLTDAQYAKTKTAKLEALNPKLSLLRRQIRLLLDFGLMKTNSYEYASKQLNGIGLELGGWIRQRKKKERDDEAT